MHSRKTNLKRMRNKIASAVLNRVVRKTTANGDNIICIAKKHGIIKFGILCPKKEQ